MSQTRYAIDVKTRNHIFIDTLASGVARSKCFECPCCSKTLFYVAHKKTPHFKHRPHESCIRDKNEIKRIHKECEDIIKNQSSSFHKKWQDTFPKECQEVRISENNNMHIADIHIESKNKAINIVGDSNETNIFENKTHLVIEIQHSSLSELQALKRESFYNTKDRGIIWIVDISHIQHMIFDIKTLNSKFTKISFPENHPDALQNLIFNYTQTHVKYRPNILLDNGSEHLYFISAFPKFNETYYNTIPLSKINFLSQISRYCQISNNAIEQLIIPKSDEKIEKYENNYFEAISCLPPILQNTVNDFCVLLESVPFPIFFTFHKELEKYEREFFDSSIKMIASWLGIISNRSHDMFICFEKWIDFVKKHSKYYNTIDTVSQKPLFMCSSKKLYVKMLSCSKLCTSICIYKDLIYMKHVNLRNVFFNSQNMYHFETIMKLGSEKKKTYAIAQDVKDFIHQNNQNLSDNISIIVPDVIDKTLSKRNCEVLLESKWIQDNLYECNEESRVKLNEILHVRISEILDHECRLEEQRKEKESIEYHRIKKNLDEQRQVERKKEREERIKKIDNEKEILRKYEEMEVEKRKGLDELLNKHGLTRRKYYN